MGRIEALRLLHEAQGDLILSDGYRRESTKWLICLWVFNLLGWVLRLSHHLLASTVSFVMAIVFAVGFTFYIVKTHKWQKKVERKLKLVRLEGI